MPPTRRRPNVGRLSIVQGSAGTGKSSVIRKMVNVVERNHGNGSVLLMAPTGVAASNIGGRTIHPALHMKVSKKQELDELTGETKRNFEQELMQVKVVICDEMSMIGLAMLAAIDNRLKQGFGRQENFGGVIFYMFGDIFQLPPIFDTSMLGKPKPTNTLAVYGKFLFNQFTRFFELKTIMRQSRPEQQVFRNVLCNIANGNITDTDYEFLRARFSSNINVTSDFSNAIRFISNKEAIAIYNESRLRSLGVPVAIIAAKHNNSTALQATADEAQGLPSILNLATGCRVMLTQNLWVSKGLCNGSIGTVRDVIYNRTAHENHYDDFPICVLVDFDGYSGPKLYDNSVPILPQTVAFKKGNTTCTRKQFPLDVSFAITVHKNQGVTVEKAVVDVGKTEFSLGLTYVAMSRVKTVDGLVIDPPFPKTRLLGINKSAAWNDKREEIARLRNLNAYEIFES